MCQQSVNCAVKKVVATHLHKLKNVRNEFCFSLSDMVHLQDYRTKKKMLKKTCLLVAAVRKKVFKNHWVPRNKSFVVSVALCASPRSSCVPFALRYHCYSNMPYQQAHLAALLYKNSGKTILLFSMHAPMQVTSLCGTD